VSLRALSPANQPLPAHVRARTMVACRTLVGTIVAVSLALVLLGARLAAAAATRDDALAAVAEVLDVTVSRAAATGGVVSAPKRAAAVVTLVSAIVSDMDALSGAGTCVARVAFGALVLNSHCARARKRAADARVRCDGGDGEGGEWQTLHAVDGVHTKTFANVDAASEDSVKKRQFLQALLYVYAQLQCAAPSPRLSHSFGRRAHLDSASPSAHAPDVRVLLLSDFVPDTAADAAPEDTWLPTAPVHCSLALRPAVASRSAPERVIEIAALQRRPSRDLDVVAFDVDDGSGERQVVPDRALADVAPKLSAPLLERLCDKTPVTDSETLVLIDEEEGTEMVGAILGCVCLAGWLAFWASGCDGHVLQSTGGHLAQARARSSHDSNDIPHHGGMRPQRGPLGGVEHAGGCHCARLEGACTACSAQAP
jgi:hypothetical protein